MKITKTAGRLCRRPPERGQEHAHQQARRPEGGHRFEQAADHAHAHHGSFEQKRHAVRLSGHAGSAQAAQHSWGDYMCKVVTDTVSEVDAAMLVVEPIANIGPAEESLIAQIKAHHMPAVLVINKIDTVKKEELLERHRDLRRSARVRGGRAHLRAHGRGSGRPAGRAFEVRHRGPAAVPGGYGLRPAGAPARRGDHPREDAPPARPRGSARRGCRH